MAGQGGAGTIECHFYDTAFSRNDLDTTGGEGVHYHIQIRDCLDLYNVGVTTTGVYEVQWAGRMTKRVRCNMDLEGGGWTVFHRRFLPFTQDFAKEWSDFKTGFGDVSDQFWLGNDFLHEMTTTATSQKHYVMVYGKKEDGTEAISKYGSFYIENDENFYRMNFNNTLLSGIHSLKDNSKIDNRKDNNGMAFSTKDKDNDLIEDKSCVNYYETGAFWLNKCSNIYTSSTVKLRWAQFNSDNPLAELSVMVKRM